MISVCALLIRPEKKILKVFNATIVIDDNHTQVVSSSFFSPKEPRKKM